MESLTDSAIKSFLENSRLYQETSYQLPSINRADIHIKQVEGACSECGKNRPFKTAIHVDAFRRAMEGKALSSGHTTFEFQCLTCDKAKLIFGVLHTIHDRTITLQKIGEYPRRRLARDPQLKKFISNDSECYEKAIVCLAQGHGIGAFAYFRRIIEGNIYALLAMLKEELEATGGNDLLLQELEKLNTNAPMSTKIEIANRALPEYLIISGLNPLGALYGALSEGIHAHSDEVCLQKSAAIEESLKYLVSELASRKKRRDSFASIVNRI